MVRFKRKPGAHYTPDEAEARIPEVARRVALEAVDLVIALDRHQINSQAVERRLWSLTGQVGHLNRLVHVVWKFKALEQATAG